MLPCQNLIHNCRVLAVADHGPGPGGRFPARERAAPRVFGLPTKPGYGTLSQQNEDKPRRVAEAAAAALAIANAAVFGSDDEDDEDEPAVSEAEALQIDLSQERSPTRSPEAKRARGRDRTRSTERDTGRETEEDDFEEDDGEDDAPPPRAPPAGHAKRGGAAPVRRVLSSSRAEVGKLLFVVAMSSTTDPASFCAQDAISGALAKPVGTVKTMTGVHSVRLSCHAFCWTTDLFCNFWRPPPTLYCASSTTSSRNTRSRKRRTLLTSPETSWRTRRWRSATLQKKVCGFVSLSSRLLVCFDPASHLYVISALAPIDTFKEVGHVGRARACALWQAQVLENGISFESGKKYMDHVMSYWKDWQGTYCASSLALRAALSARRSPRGALRAALSSRRSRRGALRAALSALPHPVVAKRQNGWPAFSTSVDRFLKESRTFRG